MIDIIRRFFYRNKVIPMDYGLSWLIYRFIKEIYSWWDFFIFIVKGDAIRITRTMRELRSHRTRHTAVIIGGGPSITGEMLDALINNRSKISLFTMSYFSESVYAKKIIPDFHCLSDPAHLNSTSDRLAKKNQALISYLTHNEVKVITPDETKAADLGIETQGFCDIESKLFKSHKPWFPRGFCSNTLAKSVRIAQYLGYDRIFILGFDYDQFKSFTYTVDANLLINNRHHYGEECASFNPYFANPAHILSWLARDLRSFDELSSENTIVVGGDSYVHSFQKIHPSAFIKFIEDLD